MAFSPLESGTPREPTAAEGGGGRRQFWMVTTAMRTELQFHQQQFTVSVRMKLFWPDPTFDEVKLTQQDTEKTAGEFIAEGQFKADGTLNLGWGFAGDPGDEHVPINLKRPFANVAHGEDAQVELDWMAYHSEYCLVSVQFHCDLTCVCQSSQLVGYPHHHPK